jgi:alkanesulfonate monooxygenase SsuD/methylene tetrahydromethanopterin reductase-like flavin-dependent oxidoreductase (luciferase family)
MRLGMFVMPLHQMGRTYTDMFREDREAVILIDQLGFEEAWVGEHFTLSSEPIADPLQFLATLIDATSDIKLGTAVICLPLHHPLQVAARTAQFDHLSKGRFLMGVGAGGLATDLEAFGINPSEGGSMMMESIDMIEAIWANPAPYRFEGKHWTIILEKSVDDEVGAGRVIKPYRGNPPLATSAMSMNSASAKVAGERGWGLLSANFIPSEALAAHWRTYSDGARAVGRTADPEQWRVTRNLCIAPTDEEAKAFLARDDTGYIKYYEHIYARLVKTGKGATLGGGDISPRSLAEKFVVVGSPETVARELSALREEVGPFGTLLAAKEDWLHPDFQRRSLELLAKHVRPALTGKIDTVETA